MATGFIGTSSAIGITNGASTSGTQYTYTVPLSGVRYAVIYYAYSLSVTLLTTTTGVKGQAYIIGTLQPFIETYMLGSAGGEMGANEQNQTGSIILTPGQSFTYYVVAAPLNNNGSVVCSASMTASVLEVV